MLYRASQPIHLFHGLNVRRDDAEGAIIDGGGGEMRISRGDAHNGHDAECGIGAAHPADLRTDQRVVLGINEYKIRIGRRDCIHPAR